MRGARIRIAPTPLTFCAIVFLLCGCGLGDDPDDTPYGLRAELKISESPERTWVRPGVRHIATLSSGSEYQLYNPAVLYIPSDGRVYVWDAGDHRLKAFSPRGQYLTRYGRGAGKGPGQVRNWTDVHVRADSLYVLDSKIRRLSVFDRRGAFARSVQYQKAIRRLDWSEDSTTFEVYVGAGTPFEVHMVTRAGRETTVSGLQARDVSTIVLDGRFYAAEQRGIYIPYYYPLLLTVGPGDTTATAYPTPDFGDAPVPEPVVAGEGMQRVVYPPSHDVHSDPTIHEGTLAVQLPSQFEDSLAFDIYSTGEIGYRRSLRLPVSSGSSVYAYETGLLAVERDTTVDLYRVDHAE